MRRYNSIWIGTRTDIQTIFNTQLITDIMDNRKIEDDHSIPDNQNTLAGIIGIWSYSM